MSALHHGRVEVVPGASGRPVYTAVSVEHALPGFPAPVTLAVVTGLVPQQRGEGEPLAVGRTEDGSVVFFDPTTQTGISALTGKEA